MIKVFAIFSSSREAHRMSLGKICILFAPRIKHIRSFVGAPLRRFSRSRRRHTTPCRSGGNVILVVKYCIRAMNYKLNFNRIEPILWWRDSSAHQFQTEYQLSIRTKRYTYCSQVWPLACLCAVRYTVLINATAWLIYARIRDIIFIEIRNPNVNFTVATNMSCFVCLCNAVVRYRNTAATIGTNDELTLEFIICNHKWIYVCIRIGMIRSTTSTCRSHAENNNS